MGEAAASCTLSDLKENTFYRFNADAMLSFSHAIEDLALEHARGGLLATFPDLERFEPQRERYWQIAATLDQVEVVLPSAARRAGRIRFTRSKNQIGRQFWAVSFLDGREGAILLGKQINRSEVFHERQFSGFFSFNPRLIERLQEEILEASRKPACHVPEFERLYALDRAACETWDAFSNERAVLEKIIRKLQVDGENKSRQFRSTLNQSFERLDQWKSRLSALAVSKESPARK